MKKILGALDIPFVLEFTEDPGAEARNFLEVLVRVLEATVGGKKEVTFSGNPATAGSKGVTVFQGKEPFLRAVFTSTDEGATLSVTEV